ncbi:MAG TPA: SBBP repeat-containing protein [Candidatus Cloacimonadota bacterium]|nr:SBBP repeat-containing protein [Candidatus Cloacimonadota bacterium]
MKALRNSFLCLILLCGAMVLGAQAPQWQWAVRAGGDYVDIGYSIAIDSQDNLYITGLISGTATFGNHILTRMGGFVAKLDPSGNWLWAVQAGGTGYEEGYDIAVDGSGNAYVTGLFQNTATFGSHILTSRGGNDIFIAKLDASGNWLWAVRAGGTIYDMGYGITLDGSGNAYVTGSFGGTATFGSHTLTTNGYYGTFVAKLDPSGNWIWVIQAEGMDDNGYDIAVDGVGNTYVIGIFGDTTTFGSHTLTEIGSYNIYVAKLDTSGNWLWAAQVEGTDWDEGYGIAVDSSGNAYVTGYFFRTASFGNPDNMLSGIIDIFVARLGPHDFWDWAVKAGGINSDRGYSIVLDGSGNAYVTGEFQNTATFGNHTLTATGDDREDIFVAKLNPSGNWLWAVQAGGTNCDKGYGIALDGAGNAYVTGCFKDTAFFGSHSLTASGQNDVFVAKLGSGTPVEDELAPQALARLHNAYPNPLGRGASALIKADIPERTSGTLSIFNLRGQVVARYKLGPGSQQISFSGEGLPAGVYLYSLQCGDYRETRKLVLMK